MPIVCVMGKTPDEWVCSDFGITVMLFRDRNHVVPDSEDEIGRYKSRWFANQQEYKDVSPANCDPYAMLFEKL